MSYYWDCWFDLQDIIQGKKRPKIVKGSYDVWTTKKGSILVTDMSIDYMKNCILYVESGNCHFPESEKKEWIKVFNEEIKKR